MTAWGHDNYETPVTNEIPPPPARRGLPRAASWPATIRQPRAVSPGPRPAQPRPAQPRRVRRDRHRGGGGGRLRRLRVRHSLAEHRRLRLLVLVIAAAVMGLRRAVLPPLLAAGLAIAAIVTLAGGLRGRPRRAVQREHRPLQPVAGHPLPAVRPLRARLLQLRHRVRLLVHARRAVRRASRRRDLVLLAVGAALGLGALNEMVEFIATLAHHGAHAGGYEPAGTWSPTSPGPPPPACSPSPSPGAVQRPAP